MGVFHTSSDMSLSDECGFNIVKVNIFKNFFVLPPYAISKDDLNEQLHELPYSLFFGDL
jgi:hypothetical protein